MRPRIYQSRTRGFIVGLVYSVGAVLTLLSLLFQYFDPSQLSYRTILLALLILPPGWVVAEYLLLFDNWGDERAVRELKHGHRLATMIWIVIVWLHMWGPEVWY